MISTAVPVLNSGEEAERPKLNVDCCPLCRRPFVDRGDPATADTTRDFLRRSHAADPHRYHAALKANPVNANVTRDELSHEVSTDFTDAASDPNDPDNPRNPILREIDRELHRRWLGQQFS